MALSYAQLEGLWIKAGGPAAVAPIMAAIALAESSGRPEAINPTDNNGRQTSWGLWQISNGTHNQPVANILDPLTNAQQAVAKYKASGFRPWGTWSSGAYKKFLQSGVQPDMNAGGGGLGGAATPATDVTPAANIWDTVYPIVNAIGNYVAFSGVLLIGGLFVLAGFYMLFRGTDAPSALRTVAGGPLRTVRKVV